MSGKLILVATPIGNLEDMTMRAIRTLKEADLIAAEDTRGSRKLLQYFDIHTPMTSFHEYTAPAKAQALTDRIRAGETIALITDAGMPGISDPGEVLVRLCRDEGLEVSVVPGACAVVSALVISGLPTRRFAFEAFLSMDKKERQAQLQALVSETRTIILYEAPHRLLRTLNELKDTLGDRRISVCHELTKVHESVLLDHLSEVIAHYEANPPKGEFVLVVEGADPEQMKQQEISSWEEISLEEHMRLYEDKGMDRKEAMKAVAKDRGVSKRDIYKALLDAQEE